MRNLTQPVSGELFLSIANGDEAAFCSLFNQYKQPIYSYSFHFTHSAFFAEEITQEVFMKTWISREKLPELENFDAWIMTVTRNSCFNYLKKTANELKLKKKLSDEETDSTGNIDQYIFEKENQYLLAQALELLSPQQRLVFTLNRDKGLKNHEIAEQLNLSPNTVKTHMVSAIRRIREYFETHPISIIILLATGRFFS
jgi:RNA polymerase sigma-70 factor (family 1)